MSPKDALGLLNDQLNLDAHFTVRGDEVKAWIFDDVSSRDKAYFDAKTCWALSLAFEVLARALEEKP